MLEGSFLLPLLRAALVVALALVLYPPLAWLERWSRVPAGERASLPRNPLLPVASALKLLAKRAALPSSADRLVHVAAPLLALTPALLAFASVPPAPAVNLGERVVHLGVAQADGTLPVGLGLLLLSSGGIAAAGWAGANRLALLSALRLVLLRSAALVVVGLGAAGVCLLHDTFVLDALVIAQAGDVIGGLPGWGVLINPVGFFSSVIALGVLGQRLVRSRPDARADLVEPYAAEASGPSLLGHRLFEITDLLAAAALVTTVFLGGWLVPGLDGDAAAAALPPTAAAGRFAAFLLKVLLAAALILGVRRSLPSLRHDQALSLVWVLIVVAASGLLLSSLVFARVLV